MNTSVDRDFTDSRVSTHARSDITVLTVKRNAIAKITQTVIILRVSVDVSPVGPDQPVRMLVRKDFTELVASSDANATTEENADRSTVCANVPRGGLDPSAEKVSLFFFL